MDLAKPNHWNSIYKKMDSPHDEESWFPVSYLDLVLDDVFRSHVAQYKPSSVLEVGCGNSKWLAYLAKEYDVVPAGIDYSEEGCQLARDRLAQEGIEGVVYCQDILDESAVIEKKFDLVFSLGLVEHFDDTQAIITALMRYLNPGGVLITTIPNLFSIHGLMSWVWQPSLLAKHVILRKKDLLAAYQDCGLKSMISFYGGLFSLSLVAWEIYPRWPSLSDKILPLIKQLRMRMDHLLVKVRYYRGISVFAPYIIISGCKK